MGTDKIVLIKSKFNSELNTGGSINVQSQEFLWELYSITSGTDKIVQIKSKFNSELNTGGCSNA